MASSRVPVAGHGNRQAAASLPLRHRATLAPSTVRSTPPGKAITARSVRVRRTVPPKKGTRGITEHLRLWKFDAPVIPVRLTGGELVPPPDPSVFGWWGQPAGSTYGTTLLVGHTVHTGGGILDDLEDTPVGDIANISGARYRVARVKIIAKADLAQRAQRLFSQTGRPNPVIGTCAGYDPHTGPYADNAVVIATPITRDGQR